MGLDGTVRCTCFEEGLMEPCPVDIEDIYIDENGYLSSRTVDEAYDSMDHRSFYAQYGKLQDEVYDWSCNGCSHEDGEVCWEPVSNIAGCARFSFLIDEVGGEEIFPLLSHLLPSGNSGIYPADKAEATLAELDRFIEAVKDVEEYALCEMGTNEEIWTSARHSAFSWMYSYNCKIGMEGDKVFFNYTGKPIIKTSHFKQIPIGSPDNHGCQLMQIICLDTGETTFSFDSIGPRRSEKVEREFYVATKKAPFLFEGKYGTAERIRNLLVASIQTGNPIRWC